MTRVIGAVLAVVLSVLLGAFFSGQASAEPQSRVLLGRGGCADVGDRAEKRQCRRGEGLTIVLPPLELESDVLSPGESGVFRGSCEFGATGASVRVRAYDPDGSGEQLNAKKHLRLVWSSFDGDGVEVRAKVRNTSRETVAVGVNGSCVGTPTT
jgi:hypothetical protein